MRFDNVNKERILRLVRYHDLPITPDKKPIKRLMNKHGVEAVYRLIELHKADTLGQAEMCLGRIAEYESVRVLVDEILSEAACFSLRDLAINGNDLLELGLKGKIVGQLLQDCLEAVMEDKVPNEYSALIDFVARGNVTSVVPE